MTPAGMEADRDAETREALEQRSPAGNQARRHVVDHYISSTRQHVAELPTVPGIHEIAAQKSGGRVQVVACIQVVLVVRILQTPMIAQS